MSEVQIYKYIYIYLYIHTHTQCIYFRANDKDDCDDCEENDDEFDEDEDKPKRMRGGYTMTCFAPLSWVTFIAKDKHLHLSVVYSFRVNHFHGDISSTVVAF